MNLSSIKLHKVSTIVAGVLLVVLSIMVVIYAQVLWQKYRLASEVTPAPVVETETTKTKEERMRVLESLGSVSNPDLSTEEKEELLNSLNGAERAEGKSVEERRAVLESL